MQMKNNFLVPRLMAQLSAAFYPTLIARLPLIAALALGVINVTTAETFFEEGFESGTIKSSPNPKWSWKAPISLGNISSGMMFGESDIYSVSNTLAHSGKYSWRLNFNGRNNWCNLCGTKEVQLSQSDVNSGCVSVTGGPWQNTIYNQTNGFSTWPVNNSSGSTVCFNKSAKSNSMITSNSISAGDVIKIPYVCGVNGIVGGDKSRKSDCNKAINYLNGYSSSDFGYGKSLSRRFYIYIPSATKLPGITLKLGYAHFSKNGAKVGNTLKMSVGRNRTLELSAPGGKYSTNSQGYSVPLDTWHYFEEVFKRESSAGASDGSYTLYAGAVARGDDLKTPKVVQNNIVIGSLIDMSINGNFQHYDDANGYVYFDDFLISDRYVGPSTGGGNSTPAPEAEDSPPVPPTLKNR